MLCKLQPGLFPTAEAYSLPVGLQPSPAFSDVRKHAQTSLLAEFGDAVAVATGRRLLLKFLSLPHTAVLVLLRSKTLTTDAEATVLLLLSEWCCGPNSQNCTDAELQQLSDSIRYGRLSIPYLTELCEHLHTPPLTTKQRMELLHFHSLSEQSQKHVSEINCPAQSFRKRRPALEHHRRALTMALNVTVVDMRKLLQAIITQKEGGPPAHHISTDGVYAQGFWWILQLEADNVEGMWCGVKARGVSNLHGDDEGICFDLGIVCDYAVTLIADPTTDNQMLDVGTACPIESSGLGSVICNSEGDPLPVLEMQWWQQHVVDGCIRFEAVVRNISS